MVQHTLAAVLFAGSACTVACLKAPSKPTGTSIDDDSVPYILEADAEVVRLPTAKAPSPFWGSDMTKHMFGAQMKKDGFEAGMGFVGGSDEGSATHSLGHAYYKGLQMEGVKPDDWRVGFTNTAPNEVAAATVWEPKSDGGVTWHSLEARVKLGHVSNEELQAGPKASVNVGHTTNEEPQAGPKAKAKDLSTCACLKWTDVHERVGANCNELFPEMNEMVIAKLGKKAADFSSRFCKFMTRLDSNVCIGTMPLSESKPHSVCYVSAECAGEEDLMAGIKRKTCTPGKDSLLSDMSVYESTTFAKDHGIEQGMMAGFGSVWYNKLARDLTDAEIDEIKAKNTPYIICSDKEETADRLQIKGNEVYAHKFGGGQYQWGVSCLEGCPGNLGPGTLEELQAKQQKQKEQQLSTCPCLAWTEVYDKVGAGCHELLPEVKRAVRAKLGSKAVEDFTSRFCSFMQRLDSNVCIGAQPLSEVRSDSVCFVSAECAGEKSVARKRCAPGEDSLLSDMSVSESTKYAAEHGIAQGMMAAFGSVWYNKDASEMTEAEINQIKARNTPYIICSGTNETADRLQIKGSEVYRHVFHGPQYGWGVSCVEGCTQ